MFFNSINRGIAFTVALFSLLMLGTEMNAQNTQWRSTDGPAGGASISSIYVTQQGTLFVGTAEKGIFRSPPNTKSWKRVNTTDSDINAITRTTTGRLIASGSVNLYISDNNGQSWTEREVFDEYQPLEFVSKGDIILAAMGEGRVGWSVDNGKTWTVAMVDSGRTVENITDVAISKDTLLVASTRKGIYTRSSDRGPWQRSAVTASTNNLVAAGEKMLANTDTLISTSNFSMWDTLASYPGEEINEMVYASATGDLYAVGDDTVYHSTDQGGSWQGVTKTGMPSFFDTQTAEVGPDGDLLIGTAFLKSGVLRYDKSQNKWTVPGPPATHVLDLHATSDGRLLAATKEAGLNSYSLSDGQWSYSFGRFEGLAVGIVDSAGSRLVLNQQGRQGSTSGQSRMFFSDDGGRTWTMADSVINAGRFSTANVLATAWAYSESKGMFVGTKGGGVFHSSNGDVWTAVNDSLPFLQVYDLAFDSQGHLYAAGNAWGLFKWNASDSSWSKVKTSPDSLLKEYIKSIAVHPNGALIADDYIRRSGSSSWDTLHTPGGSGIGSMAFSEAEISPSGTIYLVSEAGTPFRSDNLGDSWTKISEGLPSFASVTDFAFTSNSVTAATNGFGVYQWSKTGTNISGEHGSNLPDKFALHDNYPNPFNPTTNISYSLPHQAKVRLTVYNMLGRRVATLVNDIRKAGRHRVTFRADNLASGVYIYQLKTDRFATSKKMLLLK